MKSGYRLHDGAVVRWLDRTTGNLEIYRGHGTWERWPDPYEWIYGAPLEGDALATQLKVIDEATKTFAAETIARTIGNVAREVAGGGTTT